MQAGVAFEELASGGVAVTPGANSLQLDVTLRAGAAGRQRHVRQRRGRAACRADLVSAQFFGAVGCRWVRRPSG